MKVEIDVTRRLESEEDVDHTRRALENSNIFNVIVTPINKLKFSFSFLSCFLKSEVPVNLTICPEKKGL